MENLIAYLILLALILKVNYGLGELNKRYDESVAGLGYNRSKLAQAKKEKDEPTQTEDENG